MKELQMNWSKLSPDLKDKVLDIMVDGILEDDFKNKLLLRLSIATPQTSSSSPTRFFSKSSFGKSSNLMLTVILIIIIVFLVSQ